MDFMISVFSGMTGSGKTYLLHKLREKGHQVLDLEGEAKHKGSLLGRFDGENQPTHKCYQSLLRKRLVDMDPEKTVWIESESIRIGYLTVPNILFQEMCKSKRYTINLPIEERIKCSIRDYPHWMRESNQENLLNILSLLVKFQGHEKVDYWKLLVHKQSWEELVRELLTFHYDPSYRHSIKKNKLSSEEEQVYMENQSDPHVDSTIEYLVNT